MTPQTERFRPPDAEDERDYEQEQDDALERGDRLIDQQVDQEADNRSSE